MSRFHPIPKPLRVLVAFFLVFPVAHVNAVDLQREVLAPSHDEPTSNLRRPLRGEPANATRGMTFKQRYQEALENPVAWRGVWLASIAGASTMIGGFVVFFFPHGAPPPLMAFGLSLAAGAMLTISAILLVTAFPCTWWVYAMFFVGVALTSMMVAAVHRLEESAGDDVESASLVDGKAGGRSDAWRLAMLLMISLTLHNFPEGMAVGVSSIGGGHTADTITFGIAMHNIPEGVVVAIAVYASTQSQWKAVLSSFLCGIPQPLGAFVSLFALKDVEDVESMDFLQMLVAGVMVYISFMELLPEARAVNQPFWAYAGFVTGCLVLGATDRLVHL